MGNESSSMVEDDTPPQVLESRSLKGLAKYINSGKVKQVVVMTGAGISTSAGIPDFRSPETGLYANLARLNLPHAEAVFEISFFRENPLPFYTLAQELYPGKFRPTITHSFIKLLHDKGLLLKHFTQNIDCLDREAGVPGDKIIEAHGSFARQSCIDCHAPFPDDAMRTAIRKKEPPHCKRGGCNGLVKPEIVFFGEALPAEFFAGRALPAQADLCIVMGTSLTVQPFANLPSMVSDSTPRVLINKERVGSLGSRPDDVLLIGDCDDGVRKLASACGWLDELEALWKATAPEAAAATDAAAEKPQSEDDRKEKELENLTREIDESLTLSERHEKETRETLPKQIEKHLEGKTEDEGLRGPQVKGTGGTDGAAVKVSDLEHVFPHIKSNLS